MILYNTMYLKISFSEKFKVFTTHQMAYKQTKIKKIMIIRIRQSHIQWLTHHHHPLKTIVHLRTQFQWEI